MRLWARFKVTNLERNCSSSIRECHPSCSVQTTRKPVLSRQARQAIRVVQKTQGILVVVVVASVVGRKIYGACTAGTRSRSIIDHHFQLCGARFKYAKSGRTSPVTHDCHLCSPFLWFIISCTIHMQSHGAAATSSQQKSGQNRHKNQNQLGCPHAERTRERNAMCQTHTPRNGENLNF